MADIQSDTSMKITIHSYLCLLTRIAAPFRGTVKAKDLAGGISSDNSKGTKKVDSRCQYNRLFSQS